MTITSGLARAPIGAVYIGWGLKRSGRRARRLAERHHSACHLLEDGFLRSLDGGNSPSYSLIVDDIGIYYDASQPSRLERLIVSTLSDAQRGRARRLIRRWREDRLSKYNAGRDPLPADLPRPYVLVVDQTAGDAAIAAGNACAADFHRMLSDAISENPSCRVVVRVHPEVLSGRKQGHFDLAALRSHPQVVIAADGSHPALWLEHADAVYAVTSQLGFEALLWDRPVRVYGMPFYAGWGLTIDMQPAPTRREAVSLEQLAHACLVAYARYFDPESGDACEIETLMAWMALQRRQRQRYAPKLLAYGFSRWKQPFVRDFLAGSALEFIDKPSSASTKTEPLVTWGHKHSDELNRLGYKRRILRIEDGFLRSVGLGADLIRPLSWVMDDDGIYYDARTPSRLERLLSSASFDPALRQRAEMLRARIVEAGLTKYNLRRPEQWKRPIGSRKIALVVGQVETDAAIRFGAGALHRNLDLLKAVRDAYPDAWLLYKPHPDVKAGLRDLGAGEAEAALWCDEVIGDVPFEGLLRHIDEVHVLTSLAGFEALLRHIPVVTWGQPFYAGWGLTLDHGLTPEVQARRSRRLALDELVAATLILYPTYVSRRTRHFCSPERAVEELLEWRSEPTPSPLRRVVAKLSRKP